MPGMLPGLHHAIEKIGCGRHAAVIQVAAFGLRFPIVNPEPIPRRGRKAPLTAPELPSLGGGNFTEPVYMSTGKPEF